VSTESIAMVPKKENMHTCNQELYPVKPRNTEEAASPAKDSLQRQHITDSDPSSPTDVHQ